MQPTPKTHLTTFWLFTLTAVAISWIAWGVILATGQNPLDSALVILYILGWCGPSLAGFFWAWRREGTPGLARLASRALQFRIGGYYAIIILLWPLLFGISALFSTASGSPVPSFATLRNLMSNPLAILPLAAATLVVGPLSEEFGWRGFALEPLNARLGPVLSSLLLGAVWGVWNLPLFFMPGTSQNGLPILLFLANILALSVIFTWVYQSTRGSLAIVILLHFMYNLAGALLPLSPRALFFLVVLQIPFVLPLVIGWLLEKRAR